MFVPALNLQASYLNQKMKSYAIEICAKTQDSEALQNFTSHNVWHVSYVQNPMNSSE